MGQYILRNIEMTLDPWSIEMAINELKRFQKLLKPAMDYLIEDLAKQGVEIARGMLFQFDDPAFMTGALHEDIKYKFTKDDSTAVITAGEDLEDGYIPPQSYAMYVEYGTGVFGEDRNGHGPDGWWYPAPWGWWTPGSGKHQGEKMAWTNGMPPRPFMGTTFMNLEDIARAHGGRIIAEYLVEHKW